MPVDIDSICFAGGNINCELLLDTVGMKWGGSFSIIHGLPEPGGLGVLALAALVARRRRSIT